MLVRCFPHLHSEMSHLLGRSAVLSGRKEKREGNRVDEQLRARGRPTRSAGDDLRPYPFPLRGKEKGGDEKGGGGKGRGGGGGGGRNRISNSPRGPPSDPAGEDSHAYATNYLFLLSNAMRELQEHREEKKRKKGKGEGEGETKRGERREPAHAPVVA